MHLNVPAGIARTSFYDLLWWCVISGAAPLKRSTYHLSHTLPFGRTRKTNQADHAPLLPIISLICSPLCLRFLLALSFYYLAPSLIVIVFFYPCHWCVFNFFLDVFCFLPCLGFSSSISLLLIHASPNPLFHVAKKLFSQESAIFIIPLVHFIH